MATTSELMAGDRVELHPATEAWWRGLRFATVVATQENSPLVKIEFDRLPGEELLYNKRDLTRLEEA